MNEHMQRGRPESGHLFFINPTSLYSTHICSLRDIRDYLALGKEPLQLQYQTQVPDTPAITLSFFWLGRYLLVHGHVLKGQENPDVQTTQLNWTRYSLQQRRAYAQPDCRSLPDLAVQLRNDVLNPLVDEVRACIGLPPVSRRAYPWAETGLTLP